MSYKLNALKDTPSSKDHLVAPPLMPVLTSVDLSEWMPPITDQGQEGSCTAQTGVRILAWLYKRFKNEDLAFSAQFLYRAERLSEGDALSDAGAMSRTMMACMKEVGVCLETTDPYQDSGWSTPTTQDMLAEAAKYKIGAYHRVSDLATLKSVLSSGYPASMAINVYDSFQSDLVAGTGTVSLPNPRRERNLGGHEVTVYGYSDISKVLLLDNSWGSKWGNKGQFTLPYDYWPFVMDCWTAHLGPSWKG